MLRLRATAGLEQVEAAAARPANGILWRMAVSREHTECVIDDEDVIDDEEEEWSPRKLSRQAPVQEVQRLLQVSVQLPDGTDPPPIPGTRFCIYDDRKPVLEYSVEALPVPDELALVLLMPVAATDSEDPMVSGALRALVWKRPRDMWATVRYEPYRPWLISATLIGQTIEIPAPEEVAVVADAPVFHTDGASAALALGSVEDTAHGCIWDAIVEVTGACARALPAKAAPHLVLYLPGEAGIPSAQRTERLAEVKLNVPTHVIAWEENPILEDICTRSHGSYHLVLQDDDVGDAVERLYIRLLARYSVSYLGAVSAARCEIHLRTGEGRAEAGVQFRPEWGCSLSSD